MSEIQPALLTRSEIEWPLGNKEVSKLYERKIRCSIKKKIETLTELEIPLLVDMGFSVTTRGNGVTIGGNASGLGEDSLVGHGIANPHLKSNNVISDTKDKGAGSGNFASKAPFSLSPLDISNPRVLSDMGLAIPRPTRLGDPRSVASCSTITPIKPLLLSYNRRGGVAAASAVAPIQGFEDYLKAQNKRNIKQILYYARRYALALAENNNNNTQMSEISQLTPNKRRHVMEALTVYAKYQGCYDD